MISISEKSSNLLRDMNSFSVRIQRYSLAPHTSRANSKEYPIQPEESQLMIKLAVDYGLRPSVLSKQLVYVQSPRPEKLYDLPDAICLFTDKRRSEVIPFLMAIVGQEDWELCLQNESLVTLALTLLKVPFNWCIDNTLKAPNYVVSPVSGLHLQYVKDFKKVLLVKVQ